VGVISIQTQAGFYCASMMKYHATDKHVRDEVSIFIYVHQMCCIGQFSVHMLEMRCQSLYTYINCVVLENSVYTC